MTPRKFGRYELRRPVGAGATGVVYEALDSTLGRRVALKIVNLGDLDPARSQVAIERARREARAAAQVRHPNVVEIFDVGFFDGSAFLVMELVDGEDLRTMLAREGRLPLARALQVLLPVLSAVADLHSAGVVHRDIKPSNILLHGRDCAPKLADFGVSHLVDEPSLTQSGALLGTPDYMAPEVARGHAGAATDESDQFSLAVVLYECLAGRRPFVGASLYEIMHAIATVTPRPPSAHEPSLPREIDRALLRALSRDPRRRYPSVDDFARALLPFAPPSAAARWSAEILGSEAGLERPATFWASIPPARAGRVARRVALTATLALAVTAGWLAVTSGGLTPVHAAPMNEASARAPRAGADSTELSDPRAAALRANAVERAIAPPGGGGKAPLCDSPESVDISRPPMGAAASHRLSVKDHPRKVEYGNNRAPILDVP